MNASISAEALVSCSMHNIRNCFHRVGSTTMLARALMRTLIQKGVQFCKRKAAKAVKEIVPEQDKKPKSQSRDTVGEKVGVSGKTAEQSLRGSSP